MYIVVLITYLCLSAFLNFGGSRRGCMRPWHGSHSRPGRLIMSHHGVCSNHRTKPCDMLITYYADHVCLSRSGPLVGLTPDVVFSSRHNNHELEQSPTGGVFEPVRGTPNRNVPKRGTSQTAGYTLTQAFQKGVLSHTPLLITLFHPQYTRD